MCGCEGREHRTGWCSRCNVVTSGSSTPDVPVNRYAQVVDMPQLWDGDNA